MKTILLILSLIGQLFLGTTNLKNRNAGYMYSLDVANGLAEAGFFVAMSISIFGQNLMQISPVLIIMIIPIGLGIIAMTLEAGASTNLEDVPIRRIFHGIYNIIIMIVIIYFRSVLPLEYIVFSGILGIFLITSVFWQPSQIG